MYCVFHAVIILPALLGHQAQCLSVWFDSSCSQRAQSTVWSEAKDMAAKAYDKGTDPNDTYMQRYLGYIYQNVDFITKGVLTSKFGASSLKPQSFQHANMSILSKTLSYSFQVMARPAPKAL
jgi:hypothetical protein